MEVNLIPTGNSKGVRIPNSVLKECGFGDRIEMRVKMVSWCWHRRVARVKAGTARSGKWLRRTTMPCLCRT